MKIELNGTSSSQVTSETAARLNTGSSSSAQGTTGDTFTSHSSSIESLTSQALASPGVRQGVVQSLRQSVSSGQYSVDSAGTANAIMSNE
jgi:flagellar biosynthesis anti-sigma factor FlgM